MNKPREEKMKCNYCGMRNAVGQTAKERIAKNGHPRYMLGKKHSEETINKIKSWKPTPEQESKRNSKVIEYLNRKFPKSEKICTFCKKLFIVNYKYRNKRKYCSNKCRLAGLRLRMRTQ